MTTDGIKKIKTNCGGWKITENQIQQGMLDDLLRGGFVLPQPEGSGDGLVVLVRGKAGTGKSTLALQIVGNLQSPVSSQKKYFSLEQDAAELRHIYCRMAVCQWLAYLDLCRAPETPNADPQAKAAQVAAAQAAVKKAIQQLLAMMGLSEGDSAGDKGSSFAEKLGKWLKNHRDNKSNEDRKKLADALVEQIFGAWVPEPVQAGRLVFCPSESGTTAGPTLADDPISSAYKFLEELPDINTQNREGRPIIVIDGLSTLSPGDQGRIEIGELISMLRERSLIGLIAYEPAEGEGEALDHQVDMVIELEEKQLSAHIDYAIHELHIKKSRYQEAALGWHQYKIRNYGLEIYPSLHFQVHSHLYMTKQLIDSLTPVTPRRPADLEVAGKGIEGDSILETVLGGVYAGDSVALLGPRGAFKTTLTWDFLLRSGPCNCSKRSGAPPEHGLLVSIIDNESNLRHNRRCPIAKSCRNVRNCLQHVFLFYQRPGCISAAEFLYYLKTRLQIAEATHPIKRLAFWDLTQLEHRFPLLANDPMFVPALFDLFRLGSAERGVGNMIKSIFMGAANARFTKAVSATADNVVFCWRDRVAKVDSTNDDREKFLARLEQSPWGGGPEKAETFLSREYLLLYVDRAAGRPGNEKKPLYAFSISHDQGATLILPQGEWNVADHEIRRDMTGYFKEADGQIGRINKLQGFDESQAAQ